MAVRCPDGMTCEAPPERIYYRLSNGGSMEVWKNFGSGVQLRLYGIDWEMAWKIASRCATVPRKIRERGMPKEDGWVWNGGRQVQVRVTENAINIDDPRQPSRRVIHIQNGGEFFLIQQHYVKDRSD